MPHDLTMGFESEATAREWRKKLLDVFETLPDPATLTYGMASRETSTIQGSSPSATPSRRGIFGMLRPPKVQGTPSKARISLPDGDFASIQEGVPAPIAVPGLPPASAAKTPAPASVTKRGLFGGHRRSRSEVPAAGLLPEDLAKVRFNLPVINSPEDSATKATSPSPLPTSGPSLGPRASADGHDSPPRPLSLKLERNGSLAAPKPLVVPCSVPSTPSQNSYLHARPRHMRNDSSSSMDSFTMGEGVVNAESSQRRIDRLSAASSRSQGEELRWVSAKRVHGVSIYHEQDVGCECGGTYMVSVVVRGHPEAVFRAVMDSRTHFNTPHLPLVNLHVEQSLGPQSQILTGDILPEAWLPTRVAGRRHVTVERTWRHEDVDGSYVVLFTSIDPEEIAALQAGPSGGFGGAPSFYLQGKSNSSTDLLPRSTPPAGLVVREDPPVEPLTPPVQDRPAALAVARSTRPNSRAPWPFNRMFNWARQPVAATIESAGYTIAPLQPKFCMGGDTSPECLVTMVLRVDLGGWLGGDLQSHARNPASWAVQALRRRAVQWWVEPMLLSVLALRDRVEQERFVVRPFRQEMGTAGALPASVSAKEALSTRVSEMSVTTMGKDSEPGSRAGAPRTATEVLTGMSKHRRIQSQSTAASPSMSREEGPTTPGGSFTLNGAAPDEEGGARRPPALKTSGGSKGSTEERQGERPQTLHSFHGSFLSRTDSFFVFST